MGIIFQENTGEFHLYNGQISYLMKILRNGQLGQLYFGKKSRRRKIMVICWRTAIDRPAPMFLTMITPSR